MSIRSFTALLAAAALAGPLYAQNTIEARIFCSGAFVVPNNASTAMAQGHVSYDPAANALVYDVSAVGLGSAATAANLRVGAAGTNGPVVFPLTAVGASQWAGTTAPLSAAQLNDFLSDRHYVEIETAGLPAGEVRGQVVLPVNYATKAMSGANFAPPIPTPAMGVGRFRYDSAAKNFTYDVSFGGLLGVPTLAHVHEAPPFVPGPIIFDLIFTGPNQLSGSSPALTDAQLVSAFTEGYYAAMHSTIFAPPEGELRDQLTVGFLNTDTEILSIANGGVQSLFLDAGPTHAGDLFFVAGTASGTTPGTTFGGVDVPLNLDFYGLFTIANPNAPPLGNTFGLLDPLGRAVSTITVPPGSNPTLAGLTLHHAGLLLDSGTLAAEKATEAIPLALTP